MLKTVSATPLRAPGTPCSSCAPADPSETVTPEEHPTPLARTKGSVGAARQRGSSPRVSSNLAQPAGVLSWERDFLLGLAVNALEDFGGRSTSLDVVESRPRWFMNTVRPELRCWNASAPS